MTEKDTPMPVYHLSVAEEFADYAKGDRITDPAAVAAALESNPGNVRRVLAPESTPAPVAAQEF